MTVKMIYTGNNVGFIRYMVNGREYRGEKDVVIEVEEMDVVKLQKIAPFLVVKTTTPIIRQPSMPESNVVKETPRTTLPVMDLSNKNHLDDLLKEIDAQETKTEPETEKVEPDRKKKKSK